MEFLLAGIEQLMVAVPAEFASSQSEAIVARLAPMVLPAGLAGSKPEPLRATKRTTLL